MKESLDLKINSSKFIKYTILIMDWKNKPILIK